MPQLTAGLHGRHNATIQDQRLKQDTSGRRIGPAANQPSNNPNVVVPNSSVSPPRMSVSMSTRNDANHHQASKQPLHQAPPAPPMSRRTIPGSQLRKQYLPRRRSPTPRSSTLPSSGRASYSQKLASLGGERPQTRAQPGVIELCNRLQKLRLRETAMKATIRQHEKEQVRDQQTIRRLERTIRGLLDTISLSIDGDADEADGSHAGDENE